MQLLSDVIFGSGVSVPGGEDISVLCDKDGFPYYKGSTFKGVFREELERYLQWTEENKKEIEDKLVELLGKSEDTNIFSNEKLVFSDFTLSDNVKQKVLEEIGTKEGYSNIVTDIFTNIRTLTSMTQEGIVKEGSLRSLRCVNKGLYFYSEILCGKDAETTICEVLSMIKWIGSMRNRGFGKVKITVEEKNKD